MAELADQSELACRIGSMQGFGKTCVAELAGEIGTTERFAGEGSLALYVGMSLVGLVSPGKGHPVSPGYGRLVSPPKVT